MREDYLHHLFRTKVLGNSFKTISGEDLHVQKFGELNPNAGPDFLNTQILLGNTVWAGSIEFHVKSSDWFLHDHQSDNRYNNVIAHFVYEHDKDVEICGTKIPTVELKDRVDLAHFRKFISVTESKNPIPCSENIKEVNSFVILQQKERALFNRLLRKSEIIQHDFGRFNGDLEKSFYISLARTFGGKVNADAFEYLVEKTDIRDLQKLRDNEYSIQAILFGSSGLLPGKSDDPFVKNLIDEFQFQKHRLKIKPMESAMFRFSKMHPHGFPTIRLAQLAEIVKNDLPVGKIISGGISHDEIIKLFQVTPPYFWSTHYRFENVTKEKSAQVSDDFIDLIFVNTIVPFLFAFGLKSGNENIKERSIGYLNRIKAESNTIVRLWNALGIEVKTAFDAQALIEQKNEFCSKKKCLFCTVGNQLLKT